MPTDLQGWVGAIEAAARSQPAYCAFLTLAFLTFASLMFVTAAAWLRFIVFLVLIICAGGLFGVTYPHLPPSPSSASPNSIDPNSIDRTKFIVDYQYAGYSKADADKYMASLQSKGWRIIAPDLES